MNDMSILPAPGATHPLPAADPHSLRGIVRLAWRRVTEAQPPLAAGADASRWIDAAVAVLIRNLSSGRFSTAKQFLDSGAPDEALLLDYAEQVVIELLAEWDRLASLNEGDTAAWSVVIERFERLAYHWLGPVGRSEWAALEAREAAAHTCADLWQWLQTNPYPFDVPFDRWSARALTNRLLQARRKQQARERLLGRSLDHPAFGGVATNTVGDTLADLTFDAWLEQTANREALLQALDQLDGRLGLVLRLWYLEQWPADEIAAFIGERVGYVYVLRFRGIEKLRKVATENERLGLAHTLHILEHEERRIRPVEHRDKEHSPS